jgi:hypothetical protein
LIKLDIVVNVDGGATELASVFSIAVFKRLF